MNELLNASVNAVAPRGFFVTYQAFTLIRAATIAAGIGHFGKPRVSVGH
jgi:hypothetical protein